LLLGIHGDIYDLDLGVSDQLIDGRTNPWNTVGASRVFCLVEILISNCDNLKPSFFGV